MLKKIRVLGLFLLITTFAFSIYSKLHDFIDFNNFLGQVFSLNIDAAFIFSLLVLSVEVYLFIQLLISPTKNVYFQCFIFITFLTITLLYLVFLNYSDNCFCFGLFLEMSPTASIIKNLILLLFIYLLYKTSEKRPNSLLVESSSYFLMISVLLFIIIDEPQNFFRNDVVSKITISQMNPSETYLLIDARTELKFREKHIKGAMNFPLIGSNIKAKMFKNQINQLDESKEDNWLIYCDNEFCSLAQNLARQLKENYPDKQIYVLKGGIESWEKYGLALGSL